jgi:hypothetical protein
LIPEAQPLGFGLSFGGKILVFRGCAVINVLGINNGLTFLDHEQIH